MSIEFLDPTYESAAPQFALARRVESLAGLTVGIVSNGKSGTRPFFDALEAELTERHGVVEVVRRTKSNFSAPADTDILREAERWHVLFAGVGD